MTTERDDLKDREERFGTGYANSQGTATNAFADPSKQFPSKHYENQPNTMSHFVLVDHTHYH